MAPRSDRNSEEAIPRDLEPLDADASWSEEERQLLDAKIDRALEQVAAGKPHPPEEAVRRLAAMRDAHLANPAGQSVARHPAPPVVS